MADPYYNISQTLALTGQPPPQALTNLIQGNVVTEGSDTRPSAQALTTGAGSVIGQGIAPAINPSATASTSQTAQPTVQGEYDPYGEYFTTGTDVLANNAAIGVPAQQQEAANPIYGSSNTQGVETYDLTNVMMGEGLTAPMTEGSNLQFNQINAGNVAGINQGLSDYTLQLSNGTYGNFQIPAGGPYPDLNAMLDSSLSNFLGFSSSMAGNNSSVGG